MRDVPAVRLNTESADSAAASERDAAAEKVAATLATQGFCLVDCGFKDKKKALLSQARNDFARDGPLVLSTRGADLHRLVWR